MCSDLQQHFILSTSSIVMHTQQARILKFIYTTLKLARTCLSQSVIIAAHDKGEYQSGPTDAALTTFEKKFREDWTELRAKFLEEKSQEFYEILGDLEKKVALT